VSGLRINFHKSQVGSMGIPQIDTFIYSKCLNYRQMEIPFKYLGITIGSNHRRSKFWIPIVDKIRSRLSRWKGIMLSMSGRICLIKLVISSLPLYYFFFFKAPIDICNMITRIQTKFLWGWASKGRKIAWVYWKMVCSPVEVGGLGIKYIGCFNDVLLAKWKWRLGNMGKGLWREILTARYGDWRNMNVNMAQRK